MRKSRHSVSMVVIFSIFSILLMNSFCLFSGCTSKNATEVVIYTSLDQVFSEPILKDFEKKTGIKVHALYDVEAAKTTGLVNKLIAEKSNPQADVFWNSEVSRTIVLKQKGVLASYHSPSAQKIPAQFQDKDGYWTGFAARARILIYNKELVPDKDLPESIFELVHPRWRGQVALANPLFGTTSTHVGAFFAHLGEAQAKDFLKKLKENNTGIVSGNSVVRDLVVQGEYKIGFTDTDDANVAIESGKGVGILYPDQSAMGTLVIPNTIALIAGAPHPDEGRRLIDYILSKEVESRLAHMESAQIPLREDIKVPRHVKTIHDIKAMPVGYEQIAQNVEKACAFCQDLFIH
ncbi:MAG: extracellular solute-binding protein [bacterium]